MDVLGLTDAQLVVAITTLLESAGDKDDKVKDTVVASLRRLARKYPTEVLQNASAYRQKNLKISQSHLSSILFAMEHICEEQADELDDQTIIQLVDFGVEEMIRCSEYLPSIQLSISNMLVAVGQKNCTLVMSGLVPKLQPGIIPHYAVLHTVANLACANVSGFIPFLKATVDTILPLLPSIKSDSIRQIFAYALGKFSEAVLEYLSNVEQAPDTSVTKEMYSEEFTIAYNTLLSSWLMSKDPKVIETTVVAMGPMFALVNTDRQGEFTPRTITTLLSLYRKSNSANYYPLTQCLAAVLQAAPTSAIEPLFDQLLSCLGSMVVVMPDYKSPQTVKNHSEVLRCYDNLGTHLPDRIADVIVKQLCTGSEKDRVEALIIAAHLLSNGDTVLKQRIGDIVTALRLQLSVHSVKVKKALVKAIVALATRGNAEDGKDFIEFLVKHCCPQPTHTGAEWEELRSMCSSTIFLLCSTVPAVDNLLWSVLLRLLIVPEYDSACATIARSLAHLASKHDEQNNPNSAPDLPIPQVVVARCLALLGSPLNNNRGPHLLNFLMHYVEKVHLKLVKLWKHKIPQLISYLEGMAVSEWSENEWEGLLLEFVSSSMQTVEDENWVIVIAAELSNQLPLYPATCPDERGALFKSLALASCAVTAKPIVSCHLDVMLTPVRTYSFVDSKACARAIGLLSRVHLDIILERLESLANSELNRRSSRLLGLMKDARTDGEIERARITLLRCYAAIATQAPPSQLFPKLESGIIQWLLSQMSQAKDPASKEAILTTIANIADSLDRNRDSYSENLSCHGQLLSLILSQIQYSSVPDPLLLKVAASIVKLPPSVMPDVRSTLLRLCFDKVFPNEGLNHIDEKERKADTGQLLKNLGILVEELLLHDVSPATLDDISTLLEPWLIQQNVKQRAAALYILKITLHAYFHNMKFAYESPSKFNQSGLLLGRTVLRCLDLEDQIHSTALDCARYILLITAKYEGHTAVTDPQLDEVFNKMKAQDCQNYTTELASVSASKLPHYQLNHFVSSLLDGLTDLIPVNLASLGELLISFFQIKGGELYHHINDILGVLLLRLSALNIRSRDATINIVVAIAKHHPKAVFTILLSQPLPFHPCISDCWKVLATDPAIAADILEKFLHILTTTPPINEDQAGRDRPQVAALQTLVIISAIKEMYLVASMKELGVAHFSDIFCILLTICATYTVGVSPPVYSPSSTTSSFIPNRDAYKINPARVTQEALKSFLKCVHLHSAADALMECSPLDLSDHLDSFLIMLPGLVRCLCVTKNMGYLLPKLLTSLNQYSNSTYEVQRVVVTAFHAECIQLQCAGQTVLIDSVLNNLLASMTDPSPRVRRLSLKGLANISYLEPQKKEQHCESVLEALMQGLDDHDAASHSEIALQAMLGLSQVLPTIDQSHIKDIQVAIALRVKPFFEKELVMLRCTSLRLLGELAVWGDPALPGFQDQVKASLVCLLMHLSDPEPPVVKACKFTLRSVSSSLEAEKAGAMMNTHLIDDATLHYQDFITDLAKHLVDEMPDQIPVMIMTALSYSKSSWTPIRGNSALFIGVVYSSSPSNVKERTALEAITNRLLILIKDSEPEVRGKAAHALAVLFVS